jgi:hypothetical protein
MIIFDKNGRPLRKAEYSLPERMYALPTIEDVRPVDPVMTNLSIGFRNDKFLWDKIAPPAEVDQKSGTYFTYTRDFWFRRQEGAERAAEGPYLRVGYGVGTSTYDCVEIGFEKLLGDSISKASQTPEDLQDLDVAFLTNLMQIELEKRVAATTFVTGVWGTSNTLTTTDQWSDYDGSDPIANADTAITTIKRNTGASPNTLFVGRAAWDNLKEHPLIIDKYKHAQVGIMTPALVANVLGVGEIMIGDSVENTAAEGATFSGSDIWTDNALFVCRNTPGLMVPAGAFTFMWNERGNVPWGADSYRDDSRRSNVSRIFSHVDPEVVSAQHGYMFLDTN